MFGLPIPGKFLIAGIAALAVVTIITLGYSHYNGLVTDIGILKGNNKVLGSVVEIQKNVITQQKEAITEWIAEIDTFTKRLEEVTKVADEALTEKRRLNELFSEHDFTNLARSRPGLIENRINRGSRASNRVLECLSRVDNTNCDDGNTETNGETSDTEPSSIDSLRFRVDYTDSRDNA